MTSPSLRSRPITRPSTGRRIDRRSARLGLACRAAGLAVCVLLISDATRADEFAPPEPPDFSQDDVRSIPPDNFRSRSSVERMEAPGSSAKSERAARKPAPRPIPGEARTGISSIERKPTPAKARAGRVEAAAVRDEIPSSGRAAVSRVSNQVAQPAAQDQLPGDPPGPRDPFKNSTNEEILYTPGKLKKVCEILPYADYEPDPHLAATNPCKHLCPRPGNCTGEDEPCPPEHWVAGEYYPRMWDPSCFTWAATNLWYNPLYFEDVALERYGHSYGCIAQPFVSVGRFGAQVVTLPYHMGIDPPCKKEYALGYYRPGDCAPKLCYQPPLSARGALAEAGVLTGLFFAIP